MIKTKITKTNNTNEEKMQKKNEKFQEKINLGKGAKGNIEE